MRELMSICAVVGIVAGCLEPATYESTSASVPLQPDITRDSCTPVAGTYLSCEAALSLTESYSGCFSIMTGIASAPVPRNCRRERVLVIQAYADNKVPDADIAYLDGVLGNLTSFVATASYQRASFELEVAGDASALPEERWFPAADSAPAQIAQLSPTQSLHALDYYDTVLILTSGAGRSFQKQCKVAVGTQTLHIPCIDVFAYRATSDPADMAISVHHEFGHALGLMHDHCYSTATGYGAALDTFEGQPREYGGRSSVMGAFTDASYSLPERVKIGWLNDGFAGGGRHVTTVAQGAGPVAQTITIDTLERNVEAVKGIHVPTIGGDYWIEARRDDAMDPVLRSGVILHRSTADLHDNWMIDGTPETPDDSADDGALPIGRTFADPANHVFITARSQTDTTATIEIQRDPVNPHAPVISRVTTIDCTTAPARCPGLPAPPPLFAYWRYDVSATDADGDPLSYSWRFGIGTNGTATESSYQTGATTFRLESLSVPSRAFVTVSDRKGGEATSFVDHSNYRAAWIPPSLAAVGLVLTPVEPSDARVDNELRLGTANPPTGTELLDSEWTAYGTTYAWQHPILDPGLFALADATAPVCIDVELRVTDPTNCSARPTLCTTSVTSCVPVPVRLTWVPIIGPYGIPTSFTIKVHYTASLFPSAPPTITWTAGCALTVLGSQVDATMPAPGCKVTVKLEGAGSSYTVSAVPN